MHAATRGVSSHLERDELREVIAHARHRAVGRGDGFVVGRGDGAGEGLDVGRGDGAGVVTTKTTVAAAIAAYVAVTSTVTAANAESAACSVVKKLPSSIASVRASMDCSSLSAETCSPLSVPLMRAMPVYEIATPAPSSRRRRPAASMSMISSKRPPVLSMIDCANAACLPVLSALNTTGLTPSSVTDEATWTSV